VNVALVAPAGTETVAGTVAAEVLLDVRFTVRPPVGAALLIVTVPVELVPPVTVVGLTDTPVTVGAVTVRVAVLFDVPIEAVIVGVALAATATVLTVNVAVVAPAVTVTGVVTVATPVALDASVTAIPPVGAGPLIVTVPVDWLPPTTDVGFRLSPLTVGASTVILPVLLWPPGSVAVMVTTVFALSGYVVIV